MLFRSTETISKSKLTVKEIFDDPRPGLLIILPALVAEVRTILTKSGEKMAFVRFEDTSGSIEGVVFPKLFKEHADIVTSGTCVLVKGHISKRNGDISLALDAIKRL